MKNTNPLYQEFQGAFFRSTMPLKNKLRMVNEYLARGDITKLSVLIVVFKEHYKIEDIPQRNKEWQLWYKGKQK